MTRSEVTITNIKCDGQVVVLMQLNSHKQFTGLCQEFTSSPGSPANRYHLQINRVVIKPPRSTVVLRPKVHTMSPVTSIVHWIWCSFLGNRERIAIYGVPANAEPEISHFSSYLGLKIAKSPSPRSKLFSSRPYVTRHLNLWS
jgi:hypothetical protein